MQNNHIETKQNQGAQVPCLTTKETARMREDYPSIEHLEAGNIAAWLVERQDQLLIRAKDERVGMNLAKLITLAGGAVGAVCYATSPLAPIGAMIAGVGYVWAVAQDMNDSHSFAPIPFIRGNFFEFLSAMGDSVAREEWFSNFNEIIDLMHHLDPFERYEFVMLRQFSNTLTDFLTAVEPGKRFYAYRYLLDSFINYRGIFPTTEQLNHHLALVTPDPRINHHQVQALQEQQYQIQEPRFGIPETAKFAELPQPRFIELPKPPIVESPDGNQQPKQQQQQQQAIAPSAQTLVNELLCALERMKFSSVYVRSSVGHTIIEIVLKPNDTTKVDAILKLGKALQIEMDLDNAPKLSATRGGVAISLPRPDRQVVPFEEFVPDERVDGIPKLVVGVDIYGNLHEYELSSKTVESAIIGGIPKAGKSQLIISMIASATRRYNPEQVKFLLFDGKEGVELGFLDGNPYLVRTVASTPTDVQNSLLWYEGEIASRFQLFKSKGVTNLDDYNQLPYVKQLPYIPAIADEIQNLFNMKEGGEDLPRLSSIASLGRAAGMPLILATQAPDRHLINRQIAAKCNSRIALRTESEGDSHLIVRTSGAENLLGKGDLLYRNCGQPPVRLQGLYIPETDRSRIFTTARWESDYFERVYKMEFEIKGGRTSNTSGESGHKLSSHAAKILNWLSKNKAVGSWVKYKGKDGRDGNFINFLSDNGIDWKSRDAAIEELKIEELIDINEEKGLRLIGYRDEQV